MRQWIRKYSWTPSWTVNLKILLDIRVTVTFQRAFQPSGGLSYWKIGTRQVCMKWLLIIRHVNSVEQCRKVSTVSTASIVSTVIARCYLHLRWYFCLLLSTIRGVDFDHMFLREEISFLSPPVPTLNVDCYLVVANNSTFAPRSSAVSKQMIKDIIHNQHICWWKHYQRYNRPWR